MNQASRPAPASAEQQLPFTHLDAAGRAVMVDVGGKAITRRVATAEGFVDMLAATAAAVRDGRVPKGDVWAVSRVAGILAAKRCGELIPLCHPLPIESVIVDFDWAPPVNIHAERPERERLRIVATVSITAKTGVEMEALTAVTVAALTVYDLCKALDKTMTIEGVRVTAKSKT